MHIILSYDKTSEKIKLITTLLAFITMVSYFISEITPKDNPINALYALIAVVLSAFIVAVVLWLNIKQAESGKDDDLEEKLTKICTNVRLATKINAATLSTVITSKLDSLVIKSEPWSRGELHASIKQYQPILLELYRTATSSIYSTTTREYIKYWKGDELLTAMIDACEIPQAVSVTRIFVFKNKEEIDRRAIEVINKFNDSARIETFVYIDGISARYRLPNENERDFAVIDGGEAIGITVSFKSKYPTAVWYFGNKSRKLNFAKICKKLEDASDPAAKILEERKNLLE